MQDNSLKTKGEKAEGFEPTLDWFTSAKAGIGLSILSFILLLAFAGGPFRWLRIQLGIESFFALDSGVYADCSLEKNKYNKFCLREYSGVLKPRKDDFYKSPKDWAPFSLSEGSNY